MAKECGGGELAAGDVLNLPSSKVVFKLEPKQDTLPILTLVFNCNILIEMN